MVNCTEIAHQSDTGGHSIVAEASLESLRYRKKLKARTIEKIVIPFAIFLISFLVFLTYHDLIRLIGSFIKW